MNDTAADDGYVLHVTRYMCPQNQEKNYLQSKKELIPEFAVEGRFKCALLSLQLDWTFLPRRWDSGR